MKRHLFLLTVLLCAALLLTGCGEKPSAPAEPAVSEPEPVSEPEVKTVPFDLAACTVTRPAAFSKNLQTAASALLDTLNDAAGTPDRKLTTDTKQADGPELLLGRTNRPESASALEGVADTSFVIALVGQKLVVNSPMDAMLQQGLAYLPTLLDGPVLTLEEGFRYVSEPVAMLPLTENGKSPFKVIYADGLDAEADPEESNNGVDLEITWSDEIRATFQKLTGVYLSANSDLVRAGTDTSDRQEILLHYTARPETWEFLSSLDYNEYGFAVLGNKIVVTGWNLTTTELAKNQFLRYLESMTVTGADGTKTLSLLSNERQVFSVDTWLTDIPSYDGGEVAGTQDAGYGQLLLYITDTTEAEYRAYNAKLESAGYTLYTSNDIVGNLSAAYTGEKGLVYTYFAPSEKTVRIVTCPDGEYCLPEYLTKDDVPAYTKITGTSITQMALNYEKGNFGMCYIITLEDGSFVVFDGGGYSAAYGDDGKLLNLLQELNTRPDGKIVIAGWFLTHEHWDHFTNFYNMASGAMGKLTIENVYLNTPSRNFVANAHNPNYYVESQLPGMLKMTGNGRVNKLLTGMKFYIRNAEFEVLYTQNDLYPDHCTFFNETSMVTRMTVDGQTVLWLGDSRYAASEVLVERYGSYIHSDICQVAHHGYQGCTQKLYETVAPQTLLWPHSNEQVKKFTSGTQTDYRAVDRFLLNGLGAKSIIIAEPTKTIRLPYTPGDAITAR